ncbi:hypothetical protein KCP73_07460 [Salmonella enterica subsp. enterica]|nr:hypothetical protein KCP73_07460 [Salmonella enterica subsp. enterica]
MHIGAAEYLSPETGLAAREPSMLAATGPSGKSPAKQLSSGKSVFCSIGYGSVGSKRSPGCEKFLNFYRGRKIFATSKSDEHMTERIMFRTSKTNRRVGGMSASVVATSWLPSFEPPCERIEGVN